MSENADLEEKAVEALRQYREALVTVENLEQEESSAHRALASALPDLRRAILEDGALSLKQGLFEAGSIAVSRSDQAWAALREATARLDSARLSLAALEQQLGYIPGVAIAAGDAA